MPCRFNNRHRVRRVAKGIGECVRATGHGEFREFQQFFARNGNVIGFLQNNIAIWENPALGTTGIIQRRATSTALSLDGSAGVSEDGPCRRRG